MKKNLFAILSFSLIMIACSKTENVDVEFYSQPKEVIPRKAMTVWGPMTCMYTDENGSQQTGAKCDNDAKGGCCEQTACAPNDTPGFHERPQPEHYALWNAFSQMAKSIYGEAEDSSRSIQDPNLLIWLKEEGNLPLDCH